MNQEERILASTADFPSTASTEHPQAGQRLGHYRLERLLGEGTFGQVWQASQLNLARQVAIKILKRQHDPALLARFQREARLLAKLSHPHIVSVFELEETAGVSYLVMEYVPGTDLKKLLEQELPTAEWSAQAIRAAALGVAHAHQGNLIHRDLKPANILVDEQQHIKVADFGLARQTTGDATELTAAQAVVGTLSYMAPEQAAGRVAELGPAVDIYSLGATLYHLLTGRPPFPSDPELSDLAKLDEIRTREPVPPRKLRPERNIPRDLETICLKCLEKSPSQRYASAAALAADVNCFLSGEPIQARPVSRAERAWRRIKRRPMTAALVAALVVVLSIGGAVVAALAQRGSELALAVKEREGDVERVTTEKKAAEEERTSATALAATKSAEAKAARAAEAWKEYIADMQQIQVAWDSGKMSLVRDLLAKHEALAAQTGSDLRGIEWYYWDTRLKNAAQAFPGLTGRSAALSADGRWLAVANLTHATVWNLATGQRAHRWAIRGERPSNVMTSSDRHLDFDYSVAISPDSRLIAATTHFLTKDAWLGSLRVWNIESGEEVLAVRDDQELAGHAITFSPDGKQVLAGGFSNRFKCWNVATGKEEEFPYQPAAHFSLGTSPIKPGTPFSGQAVVWQLSFMDPFLVSLCDSDNPAVLSKTNERGFVTQQVDPSLLYKFQRYPVLRSRLALGYLSHNGLYAGVRNDDESLDLYKRMPLLAPGGDPIQVTRLEGVKHTCAVTCRHWLAASGRDNIIRIWDVNHLGPPRELRGAEDISVLAFRAEGQALVSLPSAQRGVAHVWNLGRTAEFQLPLEKEQQEPGSYVWSPRRNYVARYTERRVVLRSREPDKVIVDLPTDQFVGVWFSPDQRYAAIGSTRKNAPSETQLWDLSEQRLIARLPGFAWGDVAAAFSPDSTRLFGHGKLFSAATGELILDCSGQVQTRAAAFSPSGKLLAFATNQQTRVWDLEEKKLLHVLPTSASLAFSGETHLVGGEPAAVWNLATGAEEKTAFGKNDGAPAIARDGRRLYLLKGENIHVYDNVGWNHLVSFRSPAPRSARELEAVFDKVIAAQAQAK